MNVYGHAADQIGLDGNEIEERRREVTALMRGADARGLKGARVALVFLRLTAPNQIEQPDLHLILWERASPFSSDRRTDGILRGVWSRHRDGWLSHRACVPRRRGCRRFSARPHR